MSLLVVRLTYENEILTHVTNYLFWHWTCSPQPSSITRPLVTCTSKQSAKLWLDMVVPMVGDVLAFDWTVIIPGAPFVHDRSHKGVPVLVFRNKSF
jgi:hypothetical protein